MRKRTTPINSHSYCEKESLKYESSCPSLEPSGHISSEINFLSNATNLIKVKETTFRIPNRFTRLAEINVAATPMKAHNPLKPPIIEGFRPVK